MKTMSKKSTTKKQKATDYQEAYAAYLDTIKQVVRNMLSTRPLSYAEFVQIQKDHDAGLIKVDPQVAEQVRQLASPQVDGQVDLEAEAIAVHVEQGE